MTGLRPRAAATITVTSTDATGRVFTSRDVYDADGHGVVDAGATTIAAMEPSPPFEDAFYAWSRAPRTFRIVATQGRIRLASSFTRELEPPSTIETSLTLAHDGLVGFYAAPTAHAKRPALLVLGGSGGGLTTTFLASSLAARGYPTLTVAYFKEPGLPSKLEKIPLEYFVRAIRWLDRQPGVAQGHVFVLGISRGSEAAQLLGVHFPDLVNGVVASVPSDYANGCSAARPIHCAGGAWTLAGRPVPYALAAYPGVAEFAHARILDERIRGPIFFVCGDDDFAWPSCQYARDAMRHLKGRPYADELVEEATASHAVGGLVPYEPAGGLFGTRADERGRERVWPALLAFLARAG